MAEETDGGIAHPRLRPPEDPRPIVVWGLVTDRSMRPIHPSRSDPSTRFRVELESDSGSWAETPVEPDGHYAIGHLSPGGWKISVEVAGYQAWDQHVVLAEAERGRRVDIMLEAYATLRIRIVVEVGDATLQPVDMLQTLCDAQARGGFSVIRAIVTKDPPPERLRYAIGVEFDEGVADHVEGFGAPSEPGFFGMKETFELHAHLPVHAAVAVGDQVVQSRRIDSVEDEVVFRLTLEQIRALLGSVRFRVVDEHGNPPRESGLCVLARSPDAGTIALRSFLSDSGEGMLESLLPGPLGIELRVPGHARLRVEVVVDSGKVLDLGELKLEPEVAIRGRVLNPDGLPADAWIECLPLSGRSRSRSIFEFERHVVNERFQTRPDGSFEISPVGRREYVLRAHPPGAEDLESRPIRVNTLAGSIDGVELELRRTTQVVIKLVNPPNEVEQILIEEDQHLPVDEGVPSTSKVAAFRLPAGHYTALATSDGKVLATREFDAAGSYMVLTLDFP
jgi:hypothetical protein